MDITPAVLARLLRAVRHLSPEDSLYASLLGSLIGQDVPASDLPELNPKGVAALQALLARFTSDDTVEADNIEHLTLEAVRQSAVAGLINQPEFRDRLLRRTGQAQLDVLRQLVAQGEHELAIRLLLLSDQIDLIPAPLKADYEEMRRRVTSATLDDAAATQPVRIRVFLSSPGDVSDERRAVLEVIEQLRYDPLLKDRVLIDPIAWDKTELDTPLLGTMTPQEAINEGLARPSECDIVVVIFWSRMGTPLPYPDYQKPDGTQYLSGTEWEYRDALHAARATGQPLLVIYRRMEEPVIGLRDPQRLEKIEQFERVETFFATFTNPDGSIKQGYNPYHTRDEFRQKFERHLRLLVVRLLQSRRQAPDSHPGEAAAPAAAVPEAPLWPGSPFPGLHAFTTVEAPIFFGRGRETDRLVTLIERQRFVGVVGASGSGKSSLVGAGLIPRLQANAIPGSKDWLLPRFNPDSRQWEGLRLTPAEISENPFSALAVKLAPSLDRSAREIAETLMRQPGQIVSLIDQLLAGREAWAEAFIFIDQFEELFTTVTDAYRHTFVQLLVALTGSRARVVVTMRSDFYQHCVDDEHLAHLLTDASFNLAAPSETLLEMITRPADRAGLTFEEGLPGRILRDTGSEPGALALMAYTLDMLYLKCRESGQLTHHAYEVIGGVQGAIGTSARTVYADLSPAAQATLAYTFSRLVTVNDAGVPTRRRARLADFAAVPAALELIEAFLNARLLVSDSENAEAVVEVAHEALFRSWDDLHHWIQTARSDLQLERSVINAASMWAARGRPPGLLWRHEELLPVYELRDRLGIQFPGEVEAFIELESVRLIREYLQEPGMAHYRWQNIHDRLVTLGAFSIQPLIDALVACDEAAVPNLLAALAEVATDAAIATFEHYSRHAKPVVRRLALRGLIRFPRPDHLAIYLEALEDTEVEVKAAAAAGLGELRDPAAVDALIRALQPIPASSRLNTQEINRGAAALALGKIGDARAVDWLIIALNDSGEVARQAAQALAMIGEARAAEPLARAFVRVLNTENNRAARFATFRRALVTFGAPVADLLLDLKDLTEAQPNAKASGSRPTFGSSYRTLPGSSESMVGSGRYSESSTRPGSDDGRAQRLHEIAKVLVDLGDARAADLLIDVLRQYGDRATTNAASSGFLGAAPIPKDIANTALEQVTDTLGRLGEAAVPALKAVLDTSLEAAAVKAKEHPDFFASVLKALGKTQSQPAIEILLNLAQHASPSGPPSIKGLRDEMLVAALEQAGEGAVAPLLKLLDTRSGIGPSNPQRIAVQALGKLGAAQAVSPLLNLLTDRSYGGLNAAIGDALAQIGEPALQPALDHLLATRPGAETAMNVLVRLGQSALAPLLGALDTCDEKARPRIEQALQKMPASPALWDAAVRALSSGSIRQVSAAIAILEATYADAPQAFDLLLPLLDSAEIWVEEPVNIQKEDLRIFAHVPITVGTRVALALAKLDEERVVALSGKLTSDAHPIAWRHTAAALIALDRIDADRLPDLLEAGDPFLQLSVLDMLETALTPALSPHLIRLLETDTLDVVKEYAIYLLGKLRAAEATDALLELVQQRGTLSGVATHALAKIGDPRAFEPLLALAISGDPGAIEALGSIGDARAVEPLLELLSRIRPFGKPVVITALGRIGDRRAVPAVLNALESDPPNPGVYIEALGLLGDPAAADALVPHLGSFPNSTAARDALAKFGDVRAIPHFLGEHDAKYADLIREVYGSAALEPVIAYLADPAARPAPWVLPLVASYGEAALEPMQAVFEQFRQDAHSAGALVELLNTFYVAVPSPRSTAALAACLMHDSSEVRQAAENGLYQVGAVAVIREHVLSSGEFDGIQRYIAYLAQQRHPEAWQGIYELLLGHDDGYVQLEALQALTDDGRPDHLPLLFKALEAATGLITPGFESPDSPDAGDPDRYRVPLSLMHPPRQGFRGSVPEKLLDAIAACADDRLIPIFTVWLDSGATVVQFAAVRGLVKLGAVQSLPALDQAYHSTRDSTLKAAIAEAAAQFVSPAGVPILLADLAAVAQQKLPSSKLPIPEGAEERSLQALIAIGQPAVEPVLSALESALPLASVPRQTTASSRAHKPEDRFKMQAETHYASFLIRVLAEIDDARVVEPLLAIVRTGAATHPSVLEEAIMALGSRGGVAAIAELRAMLNDGQHPEAVQAAALDALCRLAPATMAERVLAILQDTRHPLYQDALKHAAVAGEGVIMPLIAALYETGVRSAPVIEALAQFDDERVIDPVLTQLTSSDITTCLAAINLIRARKPLRAIRPLVLAIGAGGKGPGNRSSAAVDNALVEALVDYGRDALPVLAERQQTISKDVRAIIDVVIERIMKQVNG